MTVFCINPESLIISNQVYASSIQSYLDETLSLLARKWSNHSRMGELSIFFDDVHCSTLVFFNLKDYYKNLGFRKRDLFNVLLRSFKSKEIDIACQTQNMQVKHFGQGKSYDRMFAYISLNGFNSLSLPIQNWMKNPQITFVLVQNQQCSNGSIPNYFVDQFNIDNVEQSFLPFELNDTEKFEKTKHQYHAKPGLAGVPIYRRKSDNTLWYEDRFHATHFEVFDSRGQVYLGEAPKNQWGVINPVPNANKRPIL